MLENTEHNVNHISVIISKLNGYYRIACGLSVRTELILVQEKYLIRFVQVLLYLGGFRTEHVKRYTSLTKGFQDVLNFD